METPVLIAGAVVVLILLLGLLGVVLRSRAESRRQLAAAQAVQLIGMPEARLNLAQATIALALAPKSNAVIKAIDAASADVRAGKIGPVPAHLRDAHYGGSKKLGHGQGYQYSHDSPFGIADQQYAPDVVKDATYYEPTNLGAESAIRERWERIRRLIRGR